MSAEITMTSGGVTIDYGRGPEPVREGWLIEHSHGTSFLPADWCRFRPTATAPLRWITADLNDYLYDDRVRVTTIAHEGAAMTALTGAHRIDRVGAP